MKSVCNKYSSSSPSLCDPRHLSVAAHRKIGVKRSICISRKNQVYEVVFIVLHKVTGHEL